MNPILLRDRVFPPISLVKIWLHRSANIPITIDVWLNVILKNDDREMDGYPYLKDLFSLLVPHLPRWKSLTICADLDTILTLLPTSFDSAIQLFDIDISIVGITHVTTTKKQAASLISLLGTTPPLRNLNLETDKAFDTHMLNSFLPQRTTLQNLTRLEFGITLPLPSTLCVLSECQAAIHVKLSSYSSREIGKYASESFPHFRLPSLRSLIIDFIGPTDYRFLEFMDSPNLKLLNLSSLLARREELTIPPPTYTLRAHFPKSLQMFNLFLSDWTIDEIPEFFLSSRLYDIPILQIVIQGPFTRETKKDLTGRVKDVGKGKKELNIMNGPLAAIGWVENDLYQQLRETLDDLDIQLDVQTGKENY